ncbi:MAG: thiol reductant ABC exporter subunit CydC [Syntrophotaleaceae bacterium]
MKVLLPFLQLLRPHRQWALLALVSGVLTLLASVGLLAVSGWFLSGAAIAGAGLIAAQSFNMLLPSAGIRSCAVIRTAGRYAERIIAHETTLRLLSSLRVWLYRRIEPQAPASLFRFRSGDLLGRIVADIDALDGLFIRVLAPSLVAGCTVVLVCALLWWIAPQAAILFLVSMLAGGVAVPLLAQRLGHLVGCRIQRQAALFRANLLEDLQGIADLLIYGAHNRHVLLRLDESSKLLKLQEKMAVISGFGSAMLTLLAGIATVGALYVAIPLAQGGHFSGPLLAAITFGVLAAFEAVMPLPSAWQTFGKIRSAAGRVLAVTAVPTDITFIENGAPDPCNTDIEFHDVSFRYPLDNRENAVDRIELRLPQQATLALVGPSGCGKTTLAHLLTRFWDPRQGIITIGGTDLRRFSEPQLRGLITLISQETHIFNTTLRENMLVAAPGATDSRLMQALEQARLADFVSSLPQGLDTWAGEGGSQLSGGEARRLALARALLKDAPIWILDEPTEGLDNETRLQFNTTLFASLRGKTVLLITHHEEILDQMDQVCYMEKGRIVATGRHPVLLATCEPYRHLVGKPFRK